MKNRKVLILYVILCALSSCQPGVQKGTAISSNHLNYIRSLGLLAANENIILFDAQYKLKVSGNFFTDKRIAAYWTDERDTSKRHVYYALYPDIDSIKTNYIKASAGVSYLNVFKSDGSNFKVYVKADSAETKYFFDAAIAKWKASR